MWLWVTKWSSLSLLISVRLYVNLTVALDSTRVNNWSLERETQSCCMFSSCCCYINLYGAYFVTLTRVTVIHSGVLRRPKFMMNNVWHSGPLIRRHRRKLAYCNHNATEPCNKICVDHLSISALEDKFSHFDRLVETSWHATAHLTPLKPAAISHLTFQTCQNPYYNYLFNVIELFGITMTIMTTTSAATWNLVTIGSLRHLASCYESQILS